jgi:hypothetical protein
MSIIAQRFSPGPNLWSSTSCLQTVVDLGPLADALTSDVPGFTNAALELMPGLHRIAGPMRRGCFVAEVLGMMALEVQKLAGAPPRAHYVAAVRGRHTEVRIIVSSPAREMGANAFDIALAIVKALHAGKRVDLKRYLAGVRETPPIRIRKPFPPFLPIPAPAAPAPMYAP